MKASIRQISVFFLLNLPISWLIAWRYLSAAQVDNGLEALYGLFLLGIWALFCCWRHCLCGFGTATTQDDFGSEFDCGYERGAAVVAAGYLCLCDLPLHFSGFVWDLILNAGTDVFSFPRLGGAGGFVGGGCCWRPFMVVGGKARSSSHYGQTLALSFVAFLGFNLWHAGRMPTTALM